MISKNDFALSGFFKSFFLIPICLIRILISLGSYSRLKVCVIWLNHGVSFYVTEVGLEIYLDVIRSLSLDSCNYLKLNNV